MTTTEANLIFMLGTTFANRGHEALVRVSDTPSYKSNSEKYEKLLKRFMKIDAEAANRLDELGTAMSNDIADESYYQGLQDGYAIVQLLTQKDKPFLEIREEARKELDASDPDGDLRAYGY